MYATCLFCSGALGRNEAIEHFPVGRRLAFDAAKGRLWVVCPSCARWNLSPLETRWEAIEDAERAYRDTRLRASTDNIGLAKLEEGTELVRIGRPMLPEFAGWRYGEVFKSRQKNARNMSIVFGAAGLASQMLVTHGIRPMLGFGFASFGLQMFSQFMPLAHNLYVTRRGRTRVRTPSRTVVVSMTQAGSSQLLPDASGDAWTLRLRHKRERGQSRGEVDPGWTDLRGDDATRALSQLIPAVNLQGGKRKVVDDAVRLLTNGVDPLQQVVGARSRIGWARQDLGVIGLASVGPDIRLALEISLHEADERRALEGELHELAERWREAEEIAAIADSMFVDDAVDARVDQLRSERPDR